MEPLTYRFLVIDELNRVELLGMELDLTPTQTRILKKLMAEAPACVTRERLANECLHTGSVDQVTVQVFAINQKAKDVSGRKLVLNRRGAGYYLNAWM